MAKVAVFISIPKCATNTIMQMFEFGENRDHEPRCKTNHYVICENHQRLAVLEQKYNLTPLFIFTFVRNPYDRIKSWFFYHQSNQLYKNTTLNEWIKNGCKTHWKRQNETNWGEESPLLQYNFIKSNTRVDFIGKIESFETDCKRLIHILNDLFQKNNLPKEITYKPIQENQSIQHTEEISEENKTLIYKMFQKDFEYFGYDA